MLSAAIANGSNIQVRIYKNSGALPVVDWDITDSGQHTGYIRIMSYNLNEARVNNVKLGGSSWAGSGISNWNEF